MVTTQGYYSMILNRIYQAFSKDKEMFDFSNYSTKSRYYDN